MVKILTHWVLSALCLFILSFIFSGITFSSFGAALITSIVLGLINVIIKPILSLLTLPINFLTLGLFSLVINALLLMLASAFVSGFHVSGFLTAFFASIVLSILNSLFIKDKESKRT